MMGPGGHANGKNSPWASASSGISLAAQLNAGKVVTTVEAEDDPMLFTGGEPPFYFNLSFSIRTGQWSAEAAFGEDEELTISS